MNLGCARTLTTTNTAVAGVLLTLALGVAVPQAVAQPPVRPAAVAQRSATVTELAPIYLVPDNTRKPLRMLAAGTSLVVMRVQGEWLQVTFNDAQFGRRTGWIEQKFVKLGAAAPPAAEPVPPPVDREAPAPAGRPAQPSAPPREGIGVRGFGTVTYDKMSASESFKAVTEKDTLVFYGGGVQATNLWKGLFLEVAAERASRDGQRVFVGPNDEVFRLGIPVEIKMTPVDVVIGWRTRPTGGVVSYGGGGFSSLKYEETSEFADPDENVDERVRGFILLGGVEYSATRWVHVRGELRYRRFGDAIGVGGVSQVFEEDDLGSFGIALKIAVGK